MISREEALELLHSDDLIGIGMAADAVRRKREVHEQGSPCGRVTDFGSQVSEAAIFTSLSEAV